VVALMQVIGTGLGDPSQHVRAAALRACEPLLDLVANDAEVAAFHRLLPPMLKVCVCHVCQSITSVPQGTAVMDSAKAVMLCCAVVLVGCAAVQQVPRLLSHGPLCCSAKPQGAQEVHSGGAAVVQEACCSTWHLQAYHSMQHASLHAGRILGV
jgi:hypothetical protein